MLSNKTYYHGTTKKIIIAFGNIFNSLHIERAGVDGGIVQRMKVPISYAPKDKFIAREVQQPDTSIHRVEVILPRMAFEITGIRRNEALQMNAMHEIKSNHNGQVKSSRMPVPYEMAINLYAVAKTQEDALQIMEQIVPMFNPSYTLTIKSIPELNLTDDVVFTLTDVSHEDNYDAAFEKRRQVIWTFSFVVQMNFYGPVTLDRKVIKRTEVTVFNNAEMRDEQTIGTVINEVSPFEAESDEEHVILTEIEGFE